MHVCPTTATRQRPDGIVTINYDICIGCAYCDVACPYQARFKIDAPRFAYGATAMQNEVEREDPHRVGVAQKCTFCSDRIDFGMENNLVPGLHPAATPACVNACIADALHFGDADDPNSNVSRLLEEQQHFRMHEEIGTEPGFYYLYDKRIEAPKPSHEATAQLERKAGRIRTRGVEPWHQKHWDWKAAGNFICGGAGTGLFTFAAAANFLDNSLFPICVAALALVALGLFLVFLKIGRPLRFIYVLRQPRRSWMAREAWIAGMLFPIAAGAMWLESSVLTMIAAILGLLFLFSQAMILREAKGIPVWRIPAIVPLILTTGIAEGGGLFLAAASILPALEPAAEATAGAVIIVAALRAWAWRSYIAALHIEGAPTGALDVINAFRPTFVLLGLVAPVTLIIAGYIFTSIGLPLFALAGICVAAAGGALKFILVTRAGYNQGFALAHTPVRGSGSAGPPIKPGWSVR
jgi:Fe-S-cluster-containing dehydrogenase component/DMSO reductase anchor subunit